MPTVHELYEYLNSKFPKKYSCDWDNDGLMLSEEPEREVVRVLTTLDVTDEAVDYAVTNGYDVIVSHHPMIFTGLNSLNADNPVARKIFKLQKNKISVMSFHTRLDAVPGGLNDVFAGLLGLTDVTTVEADGEEVCRIGTLEYPKTCAEFASSLKKVLKAERILYAEGDAPVKRVAVCGGDGKDFVNAVKAAGADSYVTGQLSYNIMEESNYIGLNMFEAGHFYTEDFICGYIALLILKEYTQITTGYFDSNRIKAV